MTLRDLTELVEKYRDRDEIIVDAQEWFDLSALIGPVQSVAATPDRPAFFWFLDKKIVTPEYLIAKGRQPPPAPRPLVVLAQASWRKDIAKRLESEGYCVIAVTNTEHVKAGTLTPTGFTLDLPTAPPPSDRAFAPHCDNRVLHAPGDCEVCDHYPDWQAYRKAQRIAFTGRAPHQDEGPCPADFCRGIAGAHVWPGNQPSRPAEVVTG